MNRFNVPSFQILYKKRHSSFSVFESAVTTGWKNFPDFTFCLTNCIFAYNYNHSIQGNKTNYDKKSSLKGVLTDAGPPYIILKILERLRKLLGTQRARKLQQKVLFLRFNVYNSELSFLVPALPLGSELISWATSTAILQSDLFSKIYSLLYFAWLGPYSTSFWLVEVKTTVIF